MRNVAVGIVVGLVIGVVFGVSVVAPRLKAALPNTAAAGAAQSVTTTAAVTTVSATTSAPAQPGGPSKKPENLLAPPLPAGPVVHWRMESAFSSHLPQLGSQAMRIEHETWRVSAGGMEVKFFEPGTLVGVKDLFAAVKAGAIDAAFVAPDAWPDNVPALQLYGAVPFGPRAEEYLAWLYFGGGEKLLQEITDGLGVRVQICGLIAPEGAGWYRRPLTTVEDLKGLKVRMTGLPARVMNRLGALTVDLDEGDIFHALETGAIDAAEYSMPAIDVALGLHRMVRNYYFPGWHQRTTLLSLVINKARWEALTPIQQSQLHAVCGDNVRYGLAEGEAMQYKALMRLTKAGVAVRRWPREILESLEKAWTQVARQQAAADPGFAKVWKSLNSFRRNYAAWRGPTLQ